MISLQQKVKTEVDVCVRFDKCGTHRCSTVSLLCSIKTALKDTREMLYLILKDSNTQQIQFATMEQYETHQQLATTLQLMQIMSHSSSLSIKREISDSEPSTPLLILSLFLEIIKNSSRDFCVILE